MASCGWSRTSKIRCRSRRAIAAFKCGTCKLTVPRNVVNPLPAYRKCPRCGNRVTFYANLDPDPNWAILAKEGWDGEEPEDDEETEETEEPQQIGMLVDGAAQVEIINGEPFVSAKAIHALGNILPQAGDIVRLNGKYYELAGQTRNLDKWWLQPFDFDEWANQAVRGLPEYRGPSSDDIIALDPVNGFQVYYNPNTDETIGPKEA